METKTAYGNFIMTTHYTTQWKILVKSAKRLKMYVPRGCPFKNYTLFDLLKDWIAMYSWVLDRNKRYSLSDFIRIIRSRDVKANIYGDAIIKLLEM